MPDLSSGVGVFGGVVQQVGKYLSQTDRIPVHDQRLRRKGQCQMVIDGLDQRTTRFHAVLHNGRQVDAFLAQRDLAAGDPRHFEQVVHQAHHVVDLAVHHVADAFADWVVLAGQPQDVQGVANRCERVSQLVGEDGKELVLAAIGVAQRSLCLFALRDVARDLRGADDLAPRSPESARPVREISMSRPSFVTRTVSKWSTRSPRRKRSSRPALLVMPLRWNQQCDWLANGFLSRVPKDSFGTGVPGEDDAIQRLADDRVIGGRDDGRKKRLCLDATFAFDEVVASLVLPLT